MPITEDGGYILDDDVSIKDMEQIIKEAIDEVNNV